MIQEGLLYSKSHEWLKDLGDNMVEIGLTDHAQEALGDLVFVNLPQEGDEAVKGEAIADVESVKAVSDVYSPVSGTVKAVNEDLLDAAPEVVCAGDASRVGTVRTALFSGFWAAVNLG